MKLKNIMLKTELDYNISFLKESLSELKIIDERKESLLKKYPIDEISKTLQELDSEKEKQFNSINSFIEEITRNIRYLAYDE